jgi:hypothetical protein
LRRAFFFRLPATAGRRRVAGFRAVDGRRRVEDLLVPAG